MEDKVVTSIPGIDLYPIVSLLIFVAFFVGLIIWTFRTDRTRLEAIAQSPLDDERRSRDL
ncbi:MAG: cbb3-type cytochrome oxidase subunit 3 [Candidatus Kapaibacterium sp.]